MNPSFSFFPHPPLFSFTFQCYNKTTNTETRVPFLCWFGWYCLTPSNNTIEKDGRSKRGHLPTGTVTTNIKTTFTALTALTPWFHRYKKPGSQKRRKKPIWAMSMMSAINSAKKGVDALVVYYCLLKRHWFNRIK